MTVELGIMLGFSIGVIFMTCLIVAFDIIERKDNENFMD